MNVYVGGLPEQTREATIQEWQVVDELEQHIGELEVRIAERIGKIGWVRLLQSIPGVGKILAATIYLEIGDAKRLPTAGHLASYAGLVPRVFSSGAQTHHGQVPQDANHDLKWAYVEAANCTVMHRHKYGSGTWVASVNGHPKAATAVTRHRAEASWWILHKATAYREPAPAAMSSSKNGSAR